MNQDSDFGRAVGRRGGGRRGSTNSRIHKVREFKVGKGRCGREREGIGGVVFSNWDQARVFSGN